MSKVNIVNELVFKGDAILRIHRPPIRQRQWRQWRDQVVTAMQDVPALKNLGLQLKVTYLAADVGILFRYYKRLMSLQAEFAENITESHNCKE